MKDAIANIVFAGLGTSLGLVTLVIKPYNDAITFFVSSALFVMTISSIANYQFRANRNKTFHRIIITIEAVAAIVVMLEAFFFANSGFQSLPIVKIFDVIIFLAFLLFELYLGYDVWMYLKERNCLHDRLLKFLA